MSEGLRGKAGKGPAIEELTGQKGAESSLQYCTMLFCTIKWRGGQGGNNGLLSVKRRPAAPEESCFKAHMAVATSQDALLATTACSASGHARSLLSDQPGQHGAGSPW